MPVRDDGDDLVQIIAKAVAEGKVPAGKHVIHCNTPSYVGSHVVGFSNMTKALLTYFADPNAEKTGKINLIPGWVEPSDMRELKNLANKLGIEIVMYPDTSDVLDAPQTGKTSSIPRAAPPWIRSKARAAATATLGLGPSASAAAVEALQDKVQRTG